MLKLVEVELAPYDSRVLEPACGSGNFLAPILEKKLATVDREHKENPVRKDPAGLLALMSVYGIELLEDNVQACRDRLFCIWESWCPRGQRSHWLEAAASVIKLNVVCGDALTMKNSFGDSLEFSEWSLLNDGNFERREFRFSELVENNRFGEGTIFESVDPGDIFSPIRTRTGLRVRDIARMES